MKVTVIGSHLCPDTLYALNRLSEVKAEIEFKNLSASLPDLKAYLALRDSDPHYEAVKKNGGIGSRGRAEIKRSQCPAGDLKGPPPGFCCSSNLRDGSCTALLHLPQGRQGAQSGAQLGQQDRRAGQLLRGHAFCHGHRCGVDSCAPIIGIHPSAPSLVNSV